ncbi:hypothetical protein EDB19DRAFT_1907640 [Suillus lakei]|nr:hypothetical protein EDB19DRAFT_1907640 [Suillus lakei]
MSKRAADANEHEPIVKRAKFPTNCEVGSPLADPHAWDILESFLTSKITGYGETLNAMGDYLSDQFIADKWKEATDTLFSGDDDDAVSLQNFRLIRLKYLLNPPSIRHPPHQPKNPFLNLKAGDDNDNDNVLSITQLPAPKHMLLSTIDKLQDQFEAGMPSSLRVRTTTPSPLQIQSRMYLFHVYRSVTLYIAKHLEKMGMPITLSPWSTGQLYVVSDSPKTILASLPHTHQLSVIKWVHISEEEQAALESSQCRLASPSWICITLGKYKDAISYVFDDHQTDNLVVTLVTLHDFPYSMPKGTVGLLDRSRLPSGDSGTDIILEGLVVGCSFKGKEYYGGLLKKTFCRCVVEQVLIPHPDNIRLHHQSGWNAAFVRKMEKAFSKQFLCKGDSVHIISGAVGSEIGTVLSTDYVFGSSVHLELNINGKHVFWVGNQVRVMAGVHLGLQGHIVAKSDDMYHVCQQLTQEQVQVSKFYLDRQPLNITLQVYLPSRQYIEQPPEANTIEIGDYIKVQLGEHKGKYGFIDWFSPGAAMLWFRDIHSTITVDDTTNFGPQVIQVPASVVQRACIAPTIKFMKDRGYDVQPGYVIRVVESVDFPNAQLVFTSDTDLSSIKAPIRFITKVWNTSLDMFASHIGKEVFIIGGEKKGYGMRLNGAILEYYNMKTFCKMQKQSFLAPKPQSVTPPPEIIAPLRVDPGPSSLSSAIAWNSWTDGHNMDNHSSNDNLITDLTPTMPDPWAVDNNDIEDIIEATA